MIIVKKLLLLYTGLLGILTACTLQDTCLETMEAPVNIGFYHYVGGSEADTSFSNFSVNGINSDSIFYDSVNNVKDISLRLSQHANSSTFVFTFSIPDTISVLDTVAVIDSIRTIYEPDTIWLADTFNIELVPVPDTLWVDSVFTVPQVSYYPLDDTVQFSYQKHLTLISDECGFLHFFELEGIEHSTHVIQSMQTVDPDITNLDEENVKIFF